MAEVAYAVDLPSFQGPLDLLLHLIRSEEMDVHDIPILDLVEQYQEFLQKMEEYNLTIAGEYLYMLSVLLSIKAKMLLPRPEMEEEEDPREILIQQILAYEAVKNAADELAHRHVLYGGMRAREVGETVLNLEDVSLYDISHAFAIVLARIEMEKPENFMPGRRPSVREIMSRILTKLPGNNRPVTLRSILEMMNTRMEVITSFVAVLEMVRLGVVRVLQEDPAGDIFLRKRRKKISMDILEEAYV